MFHDFVMLLLRQTPHSPLWLVGWMVGSICTASGGCVLIQLLIAAIREGGLTELQACQEMALDQAQWHRQKHGDGHASLQRASLLPARVLAIWGEKLALVSRARRQTAHGARASQG